MKLITLTIDGAKYIAVPVDEYKRLSADGKTAGTPDGADWAREEFGRTLKRAREEAGLSQVELAAKLGKSQALVSRAELGDLSVSDKYVSSVLKACGLPNDWPAAPERRVKMGKAAKKSGRRVRVA